VSRRQQAQTAFSPKQPDNRTLLARFCPQTLLISAATPRFRLRQDPRPAEEGSASISTKQVIALKRTQPEPGEIRFVQGDLFSWLRDIVPTGQRFTW